MTQVVVKIIGGIEGIEQAPELAEQIGRWLVHYEPENAKIPEQWIFTSDQLSEARVFDSQEEWFDLYRTSIGTREWDGKPDRPITAFHVEVTPVLQPHEEET